MKRLGIGDGYSARLACTGGDFRDFTAVYEWARAMERPFDNRSRTIGGNQMLTRHHQAILFTIGLLLVLLAIAMAMEPGLAHSVF